MSFIFLAKLDEIKHLYFQKRLNGKRKKKKKKEFLREVNKGGKFGNGSGFTKGEKALPKCLLFLVVTLHVKNEKKVLILEMFSFNEKVKKKWKYHLSVGI